ncbi:MAG: hypothetical protein AAF357_01290 [Verrucomicrobiota bacterium]
MRERIQELVAFSLAAAVLVICFRFMATGAITDSRVTIAVTLCIVAITIWLLWGIDYSVFHLPIFIVTCAVLVFLSFAQIWGIWNFVRLTRDGPPELNVVDFERLSEIDSEIALAERGFDVSLPFATEASASEMTDAYHEHKRLSLLAAVGGAIGLFSVTLFAWRSISASLACVLFGPIGIAYGIRAAAHQRGFSSRVGADIQT